MRISLIVERLDLRPQIVCAFARRKAKHFADDDRKAGFPLCCNFMGQTSLSKLQSMRVNWSPGSADPTTRGESGVPV
jgi:hypothetical protein